MEWDWSLCLGLYMCMRRRGGVLVGKKSPADGSGGAGRWRGRCTLGGRDGPRDGKGAVSADRVCQCLGTSLRIVIVLFKRNV